MSGPCCTARWPAARPDPSPTMSSLEGCQIKVWHLAPARISTSTNSVLPDVMAASSREVPASPVELLIQWLASFAPASTSFVLRMSVKAVRSPCSRATAAWAWEESNQRGSPHLRLGGTADTGHPDALPHPRLHPLHPYGGQEGCDVTPVAGRLYTVYRAGRRWSEEGEQAEAHGPGEGVEPGRTQELAIGRLEAGAQALVLAQGDQEGDQPRGAPLQAVLVEQPGQVTGVGGSPEYFLLGAVHVLEGQDGPAELLVREEGVPGRAEDGEGEGEGGGPLEQGAAHQEEEQGAPLGTRVGVLQPRGPQERLETL